MLDKFYITTPIYYVNAAPHIGHSYTSIAADTLARYYWQDKALGKDNTNVWFLTGTDEHGQKVQKASDEAGVTPQEFVDKVSTQFYDLLERLGIANNDFIRTSQPRHINAVEQVLNILKDKGDIYQDKYEGWYCAPCETFWPKTQISGQVCPDCKRPVEKISETNYFFRISSYQERLKDYIDQHEYFILPHIRRHEVQSFLKLNKLEDLCISRPKARLNWGIPLPFSPEHVTYVWFDALINYISAVGEFGRDGIYRSKWWDKDVKVIHLIGKDILRQHAVYWPIMLMALGIRLPDTVFAHGWWMIDQAKMSKSKGNVVDPLEVAGKFGIDAYRYFLLRDVSFGQDGNFSEEAIIKRFNDDLANDLGNLVYRTLTMIEKYYAGNIPQGCLQDTPQAKVIQEKIGSLKEEVSLGLQVKLDYSYALENIWELVNLANKYVEETKPWNLAKENRGQELKNFISLLVDVIRQVAMQIYPFMPNVSVAIIEQIGAPGTDKIKKGNPLFPRIETRKKAD